MHLFPIRVAWWTYITNWVSIGLQVEWQSWKKWIIFFVTHLCSCHFKQVAENSNPCNEEDWEDLDIIDATDNELHKLSKIWLASQIVHELKESSGDQKYVN